MLQLQLNFWRKEASEFLTADVCIKLIKHGWKIMNNNRICRTKRYSIVTPRMGDGACTQFFCSLLLFEILWGLQKQVWTYIILVVYLLLEMFGICGCSVMHWVVYNSWSRSSLWGFLFIVGISIWYWYTLFFCISGKYLGCSNGKLQNCTFFILIKCSRVHKFGICY